MQDMLTLKPVTSSYVEGSFRFEDTPSAVYLRDGAVHDAQAETARGVQSNLQADTCACSRQRRLLRYVDHHRCTGKLPVGPWLTVSIDKRGKRSVVFDARICCLLGRWSIRK